MVSWLTAAAPADWIGEQARVGRTIVRGEKRVRQSVVRLSAGAIVALLSLLLLAGSVGAHATLISTDPVRDAVLPTAPSVLTLTYSEPVTVVEDDQQFMWVGGVKSAARVIIAGQDFVREDQVVEAVEAEAPKTAAR